MTRDSLDIIILITISYLNLTVNVSTPTIFGGIIMAANQQLESTNQLSTLTLLNETENYHSVVMDDYIVEEHHSVMYLTPATFLGDDSDIDINRIHVVSIQNTLNGDAYWDGSQVIFIPESGYSGPASFEYTIMDKQGRVDTAIVHLTLWQIQR